MLMLLLQHALLTPRQQVENKTKKKKANTCMHASTHSSVVSGFFHLVGRACCAVSSNTAADVLLTTRVTNAENAGPLLMCCVRREGAIFHCLGSGFFSSYAQRRCSPRALRAP